MTIFFPDFAPDRSRYEVAQSVQNALPVADNWGPFPSLSEVSDALPLACKGAISARTTTNVWLTIVGTTTKLYKLDTSSSPYSFTDYTRLAGGDYNVPSTDRWSFAVGGTYLFACNVNDDVQVLNTSSGTNFAALGGSPPRAKFASIVSEFLVLGHLANEPNVIQWSAYGDYTSWTLGLGGASKQELPDGGEVQSIFGNELGAVIFQRNKIRAMIYTADAASFRITVVNEARGAIAPYCIVPIAPGQYFYLADDGFYIFAGGQDIAIGDERVDRWFLGADSGGISAEVDRENLGAVRGFLDPFRKVVLIQYPKTDGSYGMIGCAYRQTGKDGRPGRWFPVELDVEEIVSLATPGVTIDGLSSLYASMDAIDVPFDSRLFSGGKPTIGAFTTDHKMAFFTGNALQAVLRTPRMQLSPGYRTLLQEVSLVGDIDPTDCTIKIGTADKRGDTLTQGSSVSAENDGTGIFKTLADGRFHDVELTIPAGTDWNSVAGFDENESRWKRTGRT